ncbi:MAG: pyridoxal-phosphate-dependent aminotransferase family protein [Anaerolineales bacterium]
MSPMFIPGPVDVNPQVLAAQTQPMLPHRSQEFESLYQRARHKAQPLFGTLAQVFIVTSSGTGLQEAAVRNLAKNNVLCLVNGAFSARWFEVANSNGKQAEALEVDWGRAVDPQRVADALRVKEYDLITVVHNETSTGVENPVQEIAAVVRAVSPNTIICVDAVSSLGGVEIEMDRWDLDMVLTSSQKCLATPPGLALAAVSDRALEYARGVPNRGWYFDLVRMLEHLVKDSTPATPALSLIYALDMQLDRILEEGLENRFARHSQMAALVQEWVPTHLKLFAEDGHRSKTVTAVSNSLGLDISDLNRFLAGRQMLIANGYGRLKEKTFRIAHMGDTRVADIQTLLIALEEYIATRL